MPIEIRPAGEGDRTAAEQVVAAAIDRLSNSPSVAQWGPEFRADVAAQILPTQEGTLGLVAVDGDEVVGVGSARPSRRHPHHLFLRLSVHPDHRRRGVGGRLHDGLLALDAGPHMVREFRSDPGTIAFFEGRGFSVGEIAVEGLVDPGRAATSDWIDGIAEQRPPGYQIVAAHHQASAATTADLARLLDDVYLWIHSWSPPVPLSDDEALRVYLGAALPESAFCAYRSRQLIGAGLLTESPFGRPHAHLAFVGLRDPAAPNAAEITTALVANCLRAARRRGMQVEVEASSAHPHFYQCVRAIPETDLYHDLTIMTSGPPGQRPDQEV